MSEATIADREPSSWRAPPSSFAAARFRSDGFITPPVVLAAVAERFALSVGDLVARDKSPCVAHPRQLGMALCRQWLAWSEPRIGRDFGGRDHTCVRLAVRRWPQLREAFPDLAAAERAILARLGLDQDWLAEQRIVLDAARRLRTADLDALQAATGLPRRPVFEHSRVLKRRRESPFVAPPPFIPAKAAIQSRSPEASPCAA